jgi:hypothetical protein
MPYEKRKRVHSVLWVNNDAMRKITEGQKSPVGKNRFDGRGLSFDAFDQILSSIMGSKNR